MIKGYRGRYEIELEPRQWRVKHDRLGALIEPGDWSERFGENIWIEPVYGTLMLRPKCLSDDWFDQQFGRLYSQDYSTAEGVFIDGDTGVEWLRTNEIDKWVRKYYAGKLWTNERQIPNQPMFLEFYAQSTGSGRIELVRCGWGLEDEDDEDLLELRFFSDLTVEVYRNGALRKRGSIAAQAKADKAVKKDSATSIQGHSLQIMLIPFRIRELLIVANTGGGFAVPFHELVGTNEGDNRILPDGKWWIESFGGLSFQSGKLEFPSHGWIASRRLIMRTAPALDQSITKRAIKSGYGDTNLQLINPIDIADVELGDQSEADTFEPNGQRTECVLVLHLHKDENGSPFVYGAALDFEAILDQTDGVLDPDGDGENDYGVLVTEYLKNLAIDYPEGAATATVTATLKDRDEVAERIGYAEAFEHYSNRPVRLWWFATPQFDGDEVPAPVLLIDGRLKAAELTLAQNARADDLTFTIEGEWARQESTILRDPVVLDSLRLDEAFKYLLYAVGVPDSSIDIPAIDFNLPIGSSEKGFSQVAEVGSTVAEHISRLHETYIATYDIGWRHTTNGPRFICKPKDDQALDVCDVAPDFSTYSLAYISYIGLVDPAEWQAQKPYVVIQSYKQTTIQPEANIIYVIGYDWGSERPILAEMVDEVSVDPTVPVANRPVNYIGEPLPFGWVDPTINSPEAAEQSCRFLYERLNKTRWVAEIDCSLMINQSTNLPVQNGDLITIWGWGIYRVLSNTVNPKLISLDDDSRSRIFARYCLEYVRPHRVIGFGDSV